mmetsp:Transcript_25025/g.72395  ORF Transcript_25025/g.72395 Transcript_25025/m.72395 type:complete len:233 (-) Transcript_25025:1320-2018(-)
MGFSVLLAAVLVLVVRLAPQPTFILAGRIVEGVPERTLVVALSVEDVRPVAIPTIVGHVLGPKVAAFRTPRFLLRRRRDVGVEIINLAAGIVVVANAFFPARILAVRLGCIDPPAAVGGAAAAEDPVVRVAVQVVDDHVHRPHIAAGNTGTRQGCCAISTITAVAIIVAAIISSTSTSGCYCSHRRTNGNRDHQHNGAKYDQLGLSRHPLLLVLIVPSPFIIRSTVVIFGSN